MAPITHHAPMGGNVEPIFKTKRAVAQMDAFIALRNEFETALQEDPSRLIRTPGFGKPMTAASDVVVDQFSMPRGEELKHDLFKIIGDGAAGEDVQLRCRLFISVVAARHAAFHRDDAVGEGL